jgi:hypothetical protein
MEIHERMRHIADYTYQGYHIPSHMHNGLCIYIEEGQPQGDFLRCVISNDLFGALGHADDSNLRNVPAYCAYLYNHCPASAIGSPEAYSEWVEQHGQTYGQIDEGGNREQA